MKNKYKAYDTTLRLAKDGHEVLYSTHPRPITPQTPNKAFWFLSGMAAALLVLVIALLVVGGV